MDFNTSEFRDVFFEEAAERIQELETNLLRLEGEATTEVVDTVFRAAHSLKGASATFGFDAIASFTHVLEGVLEGVRSRAITVTPELVSATLRSVDVLKGLVAAANTGGPPPSEAAELARALSVFLKDTHPHSEADASGATQVSSKELDETEAAPDKPRQNDNAGMNTSTLRVPAAKLDQLVDLVGELVIAQSMLTEALRREGRGTSDHYHDAAALVERTMRELQGRVMGVRMLPVGVVLARFPRLVRDLATSCGKKIELTLIGEDTELDKSLVERLADPLTHLMRNSIDHGVERPSDRLAQGKPEAGTITISAYTQGGSVFIEIRDDGRGLDHAKIRQRAVERGLVTAEQVMSDAEIEALIFAPGFSTADTVSEISGRGVGMDVVKRTVESMGGSIAISSEAGKGTTTRLKMPLTLAMLSGMSVSVGNQTYVIPILSIVESFRPKREQVKTLLGTGEVVLLRGQTLPIVRLHRIFGLATEVTDPGQAILVIIENEGERVALLVDALVGEQQVVVKSLDANFQRVNGVMGATVMGDGRIALILDAQSIIRSHTVSDDNAALAVA